MTRRRHRLSAALLIALAASTTAGCSGKGSTSSAHTAAQPSTAGQPARLYRVPSSSMEPTLKLGAQVSVGPATPRVGEIVVYHPPASAGLHEQCGPAPHRVTPGGAPCAQPLPDKASTLELVKRIVAGPGDTIAIRQGHVYRNGQPQPDAYIKPCASDPQCNFPSPIKVLAGHWFLLGDNRGESNDSRFWGPLPAAWILGAVQAPGAV